MLRYYLVNMMCDVRDGGASDWEALPEHHMSADMHLGHLPTR